MKLIIITTDSFFPHEATAINALFQEGLEILHVRKPYSQKEQVKNLLSQINKCYLNRIVLHEHFDLIINYQLKGCHLNKRNPKLLPRLSLSSLSVSRSCHSFEEIQQKKLFNYQFLSPIFDSVSKAGYHQTFTNKDLLYAKKENWINPKIYALGGVTPSNLPLVHNFGFGGAAFLGFLWENYKTNKNLESLINRFKKLQTINQALQ